MKTKEFIKTLQDKKYNVEFSDYNEICVLSADYSYIAPEHFYVARVNTKHVGVFAIGTNILQIEDENERMWLVDLITCFAKTPVEEREEEKKYYLKHKWLIFDGLKYLCYDKGSYIYFLSERPLVEDDDETSEFTQEHIDSIKKRFDTSLDGFDIIEVEK